MTRRTRIPALLFAVGLLALTPATKARAALSSCSTTDHRCQAREFAAQAVASSEPSRRALFWHASFEAYVALYDRTGSPDDLCAAKRAGWRTLRVSGLSDDQRKPYQRARREFLARSPSTRCAKGRARPSGAKPKSDRETKSSKSLASSREEHDPSTLADSHALPETHGEARPTIEHTSSTQSRKPIEAAEPSETPSATRAAPPETHPSSTARIVFSEVSTPGTPRSQTRPSPSNTLHDRVLAPGPHKVDQSKQTDATGGQPGLAGTHRSSQLALHGSTSEPSLDRRATRPGVPLLLAGGLAFAAGSTFGGVALYARRQALDTHADGVDLHASIEDQPTATERAKDEALQDQYAATRSLAIGAAITGGVLLAAAAVLVGVGGRRRVRSRNTAWLPTGRGLAFHARF